MCEFEVYSVLRTYWRNLLNVYKLDQEQVKVTGSVLTSDQAIGWPDRKDFPLQKGKEKLMQAELAGFFGQAYTDMAYDFSGSLRDIAELSLHNNYRRAVFISSLNALMSRLELADHTVHCKDEGPKNCSIKLVEKIRKDYGYPRVALFGLQPAMAQALAENFECRFFDLDPENIGQRKYGVMIESGNCAMSEIEEWANLFLITGSSLGNETITRFLKLRKPSLYYGTTIAGAARILGLKRFCPEST